MTPNPTTPEPSLARQVLSLFDATLELVAHTADNVSRLVRDAHHDATELAHASQAFARSAEASYTRIADTVRATPRFTHILSTGLTVLASYQLHTRKALFLSEDAATTSLLALHQRNAERVHALCLELGGGVLKLGQFLSCRADLLPEPWITTLSALQDRVPPEPFDTLLPLLESQLPAPLETLFATFDPEPLAAASLAQVHAATTHDGRSLAIKIQRPGIAELLETDIAALRILAGLFGDFFQLDLTSTVNALAHSLRAEIDFSEEAALTEVFRERFAHRDDLVIAHTLPELCTPQILVMERIEGRRFLDTLNDPATPPEHLDALFTTLIQVLSEQILKHGHFHADPHPGNFLATPDHRLALLDFGCVGSLSEAERDAYISLLGAAFFGDRDAMLPALHALGFATRDGHEDALLEMADMILETFKSAGSLETLDVDPKEQIERALQILHAHPGFVVPESFVLLGRVLAYLGGLILRYRPRIHLMMLILPLLSGA